MKLTMVIEILKNFGFPVLAAIGVAFFAMVQKDDFRDDRDKQEMRHREERQEWLSEFKEQQDISRKVYSEQMQLNRESNKNLSTTLKALEMTIERQR